MVRPIEITDALSKSSEVGRMQQNAQMRPESAQELQKSLSEKTHIQQVNTPNPTPPTDQVVLHIDEQEEEKRKTAEDQEYEPEREAKEDRENTEEQINNTDDNEVDSSGHIDIKV